MTPDETEELRAAAHKMNRTIPWSTRAITDFLAITVWQRQGEGERFEAALDKAVIEWTFRFWRAAETGTQP